MHADEFANHPAGAVTHEVETDIMPERAAWQTRYAGRALFCEGGPQGDDEFRTRRVWGTAVWR
jgi:hypothetical protein